MSTDEILSLFKLQIVTQMLQLLTESSNYTCECSIGSEKLFQVKITEKLFEVNYVPRKIEWSGHVLYGEKYVG